MTKNHSEGDIPLLYRVLLPAVSMLAYIVSAYYTLRLMAAQNSLSPLDVWMGVGTGLVFETVKAVFFGLALFLIWHRQIGWGMLVGFMSVCCSILSLGASIYYLNLQDATANARHNAGEGRAQTLQSQVNAYDAERSALQLQVADFQKRGIVTEGVKPAQARIAEIQSARAGLVAQIAALPESEGAAMRAGFVGMGALVGLDAETMKQRTFIFASMLLELIGVVCGALSFKLWLIDRGRAEADAVERPQPAQIETVEEIPQEMVALAANVGKPGVIRKKSSDGQRKPPSSRGFKKPPTQ